MGRKKKMGRPPLKDPKAIFIGLRITSEEKARLTKAAKDAGVSLSAYIMAPHRNDQGA